MPSYGSRYRVPLRRRREQKTDYQARKAFVISRKPRLVSRSSLKNTIAQIIVAKPQGDFVLASAHSKELVKKYGWKAATGNVPTAYLTGLLCGLKAKKNGISEAILDLGLVSPTKGSKVFSTMSGVVDAGVTVPHSPEKIIKERTVGYHIQDYAESLGAPEQYAPKFSTYVAKKLAPEKFNDHFVEVRNAILTEFGMPIPKAEPRPVKAKKPQAKVPEAKKVEAKPVKAEKVEVKVEAKPAKVVEAKKPEVAEEKPKAEPEAKPKAEAEAKPKASAKPKAEPKTKPAAKKAAPAKAKAEKAEEEPEVETKPKRERKKPEAKEAAAKPAKKTGGKK
jgi:large subunit ribosomal protein L18